MTCTTTTTTTTTVSTSSDGKWVWRPRWSWWTTDRRRPARYQRIGNDEHPKLNPASEALASVRPFPIGRRGQQFKPAVSAPSTFVLVAVSLLLLLATAIEVTIMIFYILIQSFIAARRRVISRCRKRISYTVSNRGLITLRPITSNAATMKDRNKNLVPNTDFNCSVYVPLAYYSRRDQFCACNIGIQVLELMHGDIIQQTDILSQMYVLRRQR